MPWTGCHLYVKGARAGRRPQTTGHHPGLCRTLRVRMHVDVHASSMCHPLGVWAASLHSASAAVRNGIVLSRYPRQLAPTA